AGDHTPDEVYRNYIQALVGKQENTARSLWWGIEGTKDVYDMNYSPPTSYWIDRRAIYASWECIIDVEYLNNSTAVLHIIYQNPDRNLKESPQKWVDYIFQTQYTIKRNGSWFLANPPCVFATDWRTVSSQHLDIYFPEDRPISKEVIGKIQQGVERFCATFHFKPKRRITFYVCRDANEVQRLSNYGEPYPGRAIQQMDCVFVAKFDYEYHRTHPRIAQIIFVNTAVHEIIHVLTFQMTGSDFGEDGFLKEGLAVAFAGGLSPELSMHWAKEAVAEELVENLADIYSHFYDDPALMNRKYAVAGSFVRFLLDRYGASHVYSLYSAATSSTDFVFLIKKILSKSVQDVENEWRSYLESYEPRVDPELLEGQSLKEIEGRSGQ
ncbi:MAG: hypothetical protein KAJ81_05730, partial [Candidatus Latescibacteria bacterium]|nr:hypothetical protein [Candidatus Latescibacterota bacterium]